MNLSLTNATMSSVEIAELTGKRHDNVMRDIEKTLNLVEIDFLKFEDVYVNHKNQKVKVYNLPRRECDLVVSGYVPKYRLAIIDRWQELEKSKPQLSRMDILQLAMDAEQEVQVLTHQVEELKPKAEFHDKVVISEDAIPVSKAAKIIGTGRTRLFAFMRQMKWITRTNEPYQSKIESGHLDVKIGTWNHSERGLQETITTLITGKGLAALQKAYSERIGVS